MLAVLDYEDLFDVAVTCFGERVDGEEWTLDLVQQYMRQHAGEDEWKTFVIEMFNIFLDTFGESQYVTRDLIMSLKDDELVDVQAFVGKPDNLELSVTIGRDTIRWMYIDFRIDIDGKLCEADVRVKDGSKSEGFTITYM